MLGFNPLSDSPISDISLPVITGTIYAVDSNDTADLTAKALVQGDISTTDSNDFAVISGEDRVDGYILATDGQDTADLVASVEITGSIDVTDSNDTADFTSSVLASGVIDTTDENDTAEIVAETTPPTPEPTIDMHDGFTPEEIKRAKQLDKKIAKLEAKKRQAMLDKRAKRKQAIADLVSPPVVKEQQPKVELQSEVQVVRDSVDLKKVSEQIAKLEKIKAQLIKTVEIKNQIAQAEALLVIHQAKMVADEDDIEAVLLLM